MKNQLLASGGTSDCYQISLTLSATALLIPRYRSIGSFLSIFRNFNLHFGLLQHCVGVNDDHVSVVYLSPHAFC
jgi:hypothetical protein